MQIKELASFFLDRVYSAHILKIVKDGISVHWNQILEGYKMNIIEFS